ncbi:MAG: ABC transporter substrate-binding protein [Candidatus Aureabacteria bacterium]|nr:ABC transporter substrate-binding protein [Candidatus Auribacterota bacterium]
MKKTLTVYYFIIISLIIITVGCTKKPDSQKKPIKIAINSIWPGYAHVFIAKENGFFEKNNVSVVLVPTKDDIESRTLYLHGEVDGLFNVFTDIIQLNLEGILTKVVYVANHSDTADVIVGKGAFTSLSDLKGKNVSFEGENTFSHLFVLQALKKAGVEEYDIRFSNVRAQDVLEALEKGKIDAGHTWEPITSQALKKGYKILGKAGDIPGIISDILAFKSELIQNRPEDIENIVKSILEARDFIYTHRDKALTIMAKAEKMSKEEMDQGIRGVYQPDLKGNLTALRKSKEVTSLYNTGKIIASFFMERGQISHMPDFHSIIEARFLENLIKKKE